jgi:hypothetical protein
MPAVGLPTETLHVDVFKRKARKDRHAVIALLPAESCMLVSKPLETPDRERIIGAFRLLQAQDIRLCTSQETRDEINSEPYGIYIPGGNLERHECNL